MPKLMRGLTAPDRPVAEAGLAFRATAIRHVSERAATSAGQTGLQITQLGAARTASPPAETGAPNGG